MKETSTFSIYQLPVKMKKNFFWNIKLFGLNQTTHFERREWKETLRPEYIF